MLSASASLTSSIVGRAGRRSFAVRGRRARCPCACLRAPRLRRAGRRRLCAAQQFGGRVDRLRSAVIGVGFDRVGSKQPIQPAADTRSPRPRRSDIGLRERRRTGQRVASRPAATTLPGNTRSPPRRSRSMPHQAVPLAGAQQIHQPAEPVAALVEVAVRRPKICLTFADVHRPARAGRLRAGRRRRAARRRRATRLPAEPERRRRSGSRACRPSPRLWRPAGACGDGGKACTTSASVVVPTFRSAVSVAAGSPSTKSGFSSTITLRPAVFRRTRPACASFSAKSRNDDEP